MHQVVPEEVYVGQNGYLGSRRADTSIERAMMKCISNLRHAGPMKRSNLNASLNDNKNLGSITEEKG